MSEPDPTPQPKPRRVAKVSTARMATKILGGLVLGGLIGLLIGGLIDEAMQAALGIPHAPGLVYGGAFVLCAFGVGFVLDKIMESKVTSEKSRWILLLIVAGLPVAAGALYSAF